MTNIQNDIHTIENISCDTDAKWWCHQTISTNLQLKKIKSLLQIKIKTAKLFFHYDAKPPNLWSTLKFIVFRLKEILTSNWNFTLFMPWTIFDQILQSILLGFNFIEILRPLFGRGQFRRQSYKTILDF